MNIAFALNLIVVLWNLPCTANAGTVWLDSLETNGEIQPWANRSVIFFDRTSPSIAGKSYSAGLGVQSASWYWIALGRGANSFHAKVGVDDVGGSGISEFVAAVSEK